MSKIQTMRKEAGFEVTDRIRVYYTAPAETARVLESRKQSISQVVLAESVTAGTAEGYTKEWEFGKEKATLTVVRS